MASGTRILSGALLALCAWPGQAASDLAERIDRLSLELEPSVIEARRYLHQHPELSNREVETGAYVARRLKKLGLQVTAGVANHGVIAVLRGGQPGPVIALRADMDGLPVTEEGDLPFKSTARGDYLGKPVGVMHACGHDGHMAMLLGVAEVASRLRADWPGTLKLIFQPAEEGTPPGEEAGAQLMVKQGVLRDEPRPEVIFGLHAFPQWEVGQIGYRAGAIMASSDDLAITVRGVQTHGARPWAGVDPIVVSAQIIQGLQSIVSRQMDISQAPVIVTIGKIEGGVRNNIIPDEVRMAGTLRALDTAMQKDLHERVRRTVQNIAESAGATATVEIGKGHAYPVTANDPALTARMLPSLQRIVGPQRVLEVTPMLGAEDFSFYQREIPGLFVFLGVRTPGSPASEWAANHSPRFRLDESALRVGVRTLAGLALDYAEGREAR